MNARDATAVRLYGDGLLIKDIAAAIGVAPNSVVHILRRNGIERPTKPQRRWHGKPDITDAARKLWNEGLCASQIAERLNETLGAVENVLDGVRDSEHPRHRYDGIGTTGRAFRRSRKAGAV